MTTYKPIDSKREEFRKYLERAGVMDALTKCLVALYEETEKPTDALEYVRKHLGDDRPEKSELDAALTDLAVTKTKVTELEDQIADLKITLEKYEPPEKTG